MNPTVRSWERQRFELPLSKTPWRKKRCENLDHTGSLRSLANEMKSTKAGSLSVWRNRGQKVVDLNHRCYAGSLWSGYFGSTKLVNKGKLHLCMDSPKCFVTVFDVAYFAFR